MNQLKTWPLALCLFLSGLVLSSGCKDDDPVTPDVVIFADPLLEAQVKLTLNLTANEDIDTENILDLDSLDLDAETDLTGVLTGISNLSGLEHATNLVYIHLGYTSVTDLTPLKDLEKVTYLRVNNTDVTSLSPVSGYTSLTYFNANTATGITDISPLAGNTGMKELILRSVAFGNAGMATIRNFTTLYRINMRSTEVTDITVLAELMALGALLDTTPGAAAAGGADLDLRGLTIDCSLIESYLSQISNIEGCP